MDDEDAAEDDELLDDVESEPDEPLDVPEELAEPDDEVDESEEGTLDDDPERLSVR